MSRKTDTRLVLLLLTQAVELLVAEAEERVGVRRHTGVDHDEQLIVQKKRIFRSREALDKATLELIHPEPAPLEPE